ACPAPLHGTALCSTFGCDFYCDPGYEPFGSSCVAAVVDMAVKRDMAMAKDMAAPRDLAGVDFLFNSSAGFAGLPLFGCTGLAPFTGNQCPLTNSCIGNDCCSESQILMQPGTCLDTTPCAPSTTPQ